MKVHLLVGVCLLVLCWCVLASDVQGVNLEDRIRELVEKELRARDNALQGILRNLQMEIHEKDRDIQLLKNQIKAMIQNTMENGSTEVNESRVENPIDVFLREFYFGNQSNDDMNIQNDIIPRASTETVAFYVHLSSSTSPRCFNYHETIIYNTEVTDTSGSYNIHDGIFIVPVTGIYGLTITVVPATQTFVSYEIIVDGRVLGGTIGDSENEDSHNPGSITTVVRLQAGSHLFVRRYSANQDCSTYSNAPIFTSFAGWLIR